MWGHDTYKIIRFYYRLPGYRRTIKRGLTLEQAQAHCADKETNSITAKSKEARRRTRRQGMWFDGYEKERG